MQGALQIPREYLKQALFGVFLQVLNLNILFVSVKTSLRAIEEVNGPNNSFLSDFSLDKINLGKFSFVISI